MESATIITSLTAVFLISVSFMVTTQNTISALFFKVVPFFLGLAQVYLVMKALDLLK